MISPKVVCGPDTKRQSDDDPPTRQGISSTYSLPGMAVGLTVYFTRLLTFLVWPVA